uniref:TraB domain-containing protein n=1 Tax=Glycine max TaxID=3847 RepID=K7N3M7_SOYBN
MKRFGPVPYWRTEFFEPDSIWLIGTTHVSEDSAMEQLSFSYPSLLSPLIHERDIYLAWSLKRSKAVNNSKNVVGVIGKGHMNGVIYALLSDTGNLRFRDLVGKDSYDGGSSGWIDDLIKSLVRDTIIMGLI